VDCHRGYGIWTQNVHGKKEEEGTVDSTRISHHHTAHLNENGSQSVQGRVLPDGTDAVTGSEIHLKADPESDVIRVRMIVLLLHTDLLSLLAKI